MGRESWYSHSESIPKLLSCERRKLRLNPEATYLSVGGLGGLGRSLAKEFVASGARNIAFLSRPGDTTAQAKAVVDELSGGGVQARAYRGDISDETSFLAAMKQCSQQLPQVPDIHEPTFRTLTKSLINQQQRGSQRDYPLQICTGLVSADIMATHDHRKNFNDPRFGPLAVTSVDPLVVLKMRNWITREMKASMALLEILAAVPIESFAREVAKKSKLMIGLL